MRRTVPGIRLTATVAAAGCAAKIGPGDLRAALASLRQPPRDRRVLVDASTLDDAGIFAHGRGEVLVQTVDFFTPIVDDPYDYGQVAAANALSDVFAMGGRPLTALALLCAPAEGLAPEVIAAILQGGLDKVAEAGASVVGGHSIRDPELKFGYAVTGVAARRKLLLNSGARVGERLYLTKRLGTGVLTTALKQGRLETAALRRVTRQMATLNREAAEAALACGVRGATDEPRRVTRVRRGERRAHRRGIEGHVHVGGAVRAVGRGHDDRGLHEGAAAPVQGSVLVEVDEADAGVLVPVLDAADDGGGGQGGQRRGGDGEAGEDSTHGATSDRFAPGR